MHPFITTVSRKALNVQQPDDESVPLSDIRKNEAGQVLDSKFPIVVIGSIAATGKSHMCKTLFSEGKVDICTSGVPDPDKHDSLIKRSAENNAGRSDILVCDEAFLNAERQDIATCVRKCMDIYKKIVVMSGGNKWTPTEQGERINEELIPKEAKTETVILELKQLSQRQLEELIIYSRLSYLERVPNCDVPEPDIEILKRVANVYLPRYRQLQFVAKSAVDILTKITPDVFSSNAPGYYGEAYFVRKYLYKQCLRYQKYADAPAS